MGQDKLKGKNKVNVRMKGPMAQAFEDFADGMETHFQSTQKSKAKKKRKKNKIAARSRRAQRRK